MIKLSWWEYKGKEKKLPKNLVFKKSGSLDMRYKVNRDFMDDKNWVYKDPIGGMYIKHMKEYLHNPILFGRFEKVEKKNELEK